MSKEFYLMMADQFPALKTIKFEDVDTYGSGFISYSEFAEFQKKQNPGKAIK